MYTDAPAPLQFTRGQDAPCWHTRIYAHKDQPRATHRRCDLLPTRAAAAPVVVQPTCVNSFHRERGRDRRGKRYIKGPGAAACPLVSGYQSGHAQTYQTGHTPNTRGGRRGASSGRAHALGWRVHQPHTTHSKHSPQAGLGPRTTPPPHHHSTGKGAFCSERATPRPLLRTSGTPSVAQCCPPPSVTTAHRSRNAKQHGRARRAKHSRQLQAADQRACGRPRRAAARARQRLLRAPRLRTPRQGGVNDVSVKSNSHQTMTDRARRAGHSIPSTVKWPPPFRVVDCRPLPFAAATRPAAPWHQIRHHRRATKEYLPRIVVAAAARNTVCRHRSILSLWGSPAGGSETEKRLGGLARDLLLDVINVLDQLLTARLRYSAAQQGTRRKHIKGPGHNVNDGPPVVGSKSPGHYGDVMMVGACSHRQGNLSRPPLPWPDGRQPSHSGQDCQPPTAHTYPAPP